MKAICYENTKTTLPAWNPAEKLHLKVHFGYAYENKGYFIHFYGESTGLQTISPGLTVVEKNISNLTLEEWVKKTFGAINIKDMNNEVGSTIKGIWCPGLLYEDEIYKALSVTERGGLKQRQALYILIKELADILLYLEPDNTSLDAYSHKLRNLLILSCTEVENQLASILNLSRIPPQKTHYDMNDYHILIPNSNIKNIQIDFKNYKLLSNIIPFEKWSPIKPTKSLSWYNAYNKTKHNRDRNFSEATLLNTINSIAANIALYCIRFGPYSLFNSQDILSSYINQMVNISFFKDCKESFYIPLVEIPTKCKEGLFCYDSHLNGDYKKWKTINIVKK